ncbi:hypothetical protein Tco_0452133 [Tanacetum coccineum]
MKCSEYRCGLALECWEHGWQLKAFRTLVVAVQRNLIEFKSQSVSCERSLDLCAKHPDQCPDTPRDRHLHTEVSGHIGIPSSTIDTVKGSFKAAKICSVWDSQVVSEPVRNSE